MGKRNAGLGGIARFVFESFKNDPPSQPSSLAVAVESPPSTGNDTADPATEGQPAKKRKTNDGSGIASAQQHSATERVRGPQWVEKYDATGLVPHYTDASQVPDHLKKCSSRISSFLSGVIYNMKRTPVFADFSQRTRFFSLYLEPPGCLLDEEGWYSVTPELVADQIAERCRCDTILDAFCGVGGNAIAFAKTCQRVIALDTSETRLALARHNAQIYGVADRIEFILSDYISFASSYLSQPLSPLATRKIDVVFLSPPWGGPSYLSGPGVPESPAKTAPLNGTTTHQDIGRDTSPPLEESTHHTYALSSIQPIHGADLFHLSRRITPNIAYYLPRNTSLDDISDLLIDSDRPLGSTAPSKAKAKRKAKEMVEVEEEWTGTKLKALTCYFGGLADGQGELFE